MLHDIMTWQLRLGAQQFRTLKGPPLSRMQPANSITGTRRFTMAHEFGQNEMSQAGFAEIGRLYM